MQKHAASRLHYDFRLELDGVLKSWAVPKGPSLIAGARHLAVRTEDHPFAYGGFEGVIPAGEYGGGTVMLWDRGTWCPHGDPHEGLETGRLGFDLAGERLRGGFVLVRTRPARNGQEQWLLLKKDDDEAIGDPAADVTARFVTSVTTARPMEAIAAGADRVWRGRDDPPAPERAAATPAIPGGRPGPLPDFVAPALAQAAPSPPAGPGWLHEIEQDGYRLQARIADGAVRLLTRNGHDWTHRFRDLAATLASLPVRAALLDGEAVVTGEDGRSDFTALQAALAGEAAHPIRYIAVDLLYLDGLDLRPAPLLDRKAALRALLDGAGPDPAVLAYSDHVLGAGTRFLEQACRFALEGAISKRCDAPYRSGRGPAWLKSKCDTRDEFVVLGWTDPEGGDPSGLGALVLGARREGALSFVGKVGTGWTGAAARSLRERLAPLACDAPATKVPRAVATAAHWVRPELVGEVAYTGWTADGRLRHPSWKGLREDKPADEVEVPAPVVPAPPAARPDAPPPKPARGRAAGAAEVAGVRLTQPEGVLFPELGLTKLDWARWLETAAGWMLPHIANRPLSLVHCPEGAGGACFYQKHPGAGLAGLPHVDIPEADGSPATYTCVATVQDLIRLAQNGVLEIHAWGCHADRLERPDLLVLDLDPAPDVPFGRVKSAAFEVRQRLAELGLTSFVKTTGGTGLHVVAPFERRQDWETVKSAAKALAEAMAEDSPESYVAVMTKAKRTGRIFIDYLRNGRGATAILPWSVRARPAAGVAWPLSWEALPALTAGDAVTLATAPARLASLSADPWAELLGLRQSLSAAALRSLGLGGAGRPRRA